MRVSKQSPLRLVALLVAAAVLFASIITCYPLAYATEEPEGAPSDVLTQVEKTQELEPAEEPQIAPEAEGPAPEAEEPALEVEEPAPATEEPALEVEAAEPVAEPEEEENSVQTMELGIQPLGVDSQADFIAALDGGESVIYLEDMSLDQALTITRDVTLAAVGDSAVLSADQARHFIVGAGVELTFENVILDGVGVAGGIRAEGDITIIGARIQNCKAPSAERNGGGINAPNGAVMLQESEIAECEVYDITYDENTPRMTGFGGGVYAKGLTLSGSTLTGNIALIGGGAYSTGTVVAIGSMISGNRTVTVHGLSQRDHYNYGGGGIFSRGATSVTDSCFENNISSLSGGGLYSMGHVTLNDAHFISNTAENISIGWRYNNDFDRFGGGGLFAESGMTASGGSFVGNVSEDPTNGYGAAGYGGGAIVHGNFDLDGALVKDNEAKLYGGGIHGRSVTSRLVESVSVKNAVFDGNIQKSNNGTGSALTVYFNAGERTLTIENCDFSNNNTTAVQFYGANDAKVTESTFTSNAMAIYGSGLLGGTLYIADTVFGGEEGRGNTARCIVASGINLDVRDTEFSYNSSSSDGGCVYFSGTNAIMDNVTVLNNYTYYNGGFIYVSGLQEGSSVTFQNSEFAKNSARGTGGVYFAYPNSTTDLTFEGCTFTENEAGNQGGAIATGNNFNGGTDGSVTIDDCEFLRNVAGNQGGAVYLEDYLGGFGGTPIGLKINIQESIFEENSAVSGGAIVIKSSIDAVIRDTQIIGNKATAYGGGIYVGKNTTGYKHTHTPSKVTISGDTALIGNQAQAGGGVYFMENEKLILEDTVSLQDNFAPNGGGAVYVANLNMLEAGEKVTFQNNKATKGYFITSTEDMATHDLAILGGQFSSPFGYGYNNFDINYAKGTPCIAYTIAVLPSTGGIATASASTAYSGETITVTATPGTGYVFKEWDGEGGATKLVFANPTEAETSFEMISKNVTVRPSFERITYPLTYAADGNGAVSGNVASGGKLLPGTVVTLTATAADRYNFGEWNVPEGLTYTTAGDGGTMSFTMPEKAVDITAAFTYVPETYSLHWNGGAVTTEVLDARQDTEGFAYPEDKIPLSQEEFLARAKTELEIIGSYGTFSEVESLTLAECWRDMISTVTAAGETRQVTVSAEHPSGALSCTVEIKVVDSTPPTPIVNDSVKLEKEKLPAAGIGFTAEQLLQMTGASATDNYSAQANIAIAYSYDTDANTGGDFETADWSNEKAVHFIVVSATDEAGNTSQARTQIIIFKEIVEEVEEETYTLSYIDKLTLPVSDRYPEKDNSLGWEDFSALLEASVTSNKKGIVAASLSASDYDQEMYEALGDYTVHFEASAGTTKLQGSVKVTIVDAVAPEIEAPAEIKISAKTPPVAFEDVMKAIGATALDNYDGAVTPAGAFQERTFEQIDWSKNGRYPCLLTATDASGNEADKLVMVEVIDEKNQVAPDGGEEESTPSPEPAPTPSPSDKPEEEIPGEVQEIVTTPDGTNVGQDENDNWFFLDENGVPLGQYIPPSDSESVAVSITESQLPKTGSALLFAVLISGGAVLSLGVVLFMTGKKREEENEY